MPMRTVNQCRQSAFSRTVLTLCCLSCALQTFAPLHMNIFIESVLFTHLCKLLHTNYVLVSAKPPPPPSHLSEKFWNRCDGGCSSSPAARFVFVLFCLYSFIYIWNTRNQIKPLKYLWHFQFWCCWVSTTVGFMTVWGVPAALSTWL